jgi:SHS2 domain-containing protein
VKKFKFLENIATADVAFEAYGKDLNELFGNAALALFEAMVETKTVASCQLSVVSCQNDTIEGLLFDFLNELIFLKDSKNVVFSDFKVKISGKYKLKARVSGEEIDKKKHVLKTDVKAVTMHQFRVEKTKEGYKARVILDV